MRLVAILAIMFVWTLPAKADIVANFSKLEEIWSVELSPDGASVALGCVKESRRGVCIYSLVGNTSPIHYAPPRNADIISFYWASPMHVVIVADMVSTERMNTGMEDIRFTRAISFNVVTKSSILLMKDRMSFSNTAYIDSLAIDNPEQVVMSGLISVDSSRAGSNIGGRNDDLYYLTYNVDLNTGNSRRRKRYSNSVVDILFDENANELVRTVYKENSGVFELRTSGNRKIFTKSNVPIQPLAATGVSADGSHLILWSDGVADIGRGVWQLPIEGGELSRVSVGNFTIQGHSPIVDRYTSTVVGYRYSDDLAGQIFADEELRRYQQMLSNTLPGQRVRILSWTRDRGLLVVLAEAAGRPADYYLFDPGARELSILGARYSHLADRQMGDVVKVAYPAADGLEIPAYLTLPPGKSRDDGPFPILLMPHGGPDASDNASFDWWAQAYAAAGYAVLQPNFRGSNRYGAAFREAGFGEFGGKMVTDVTDGYDWLVSDGIGQAGGACVVGASYGGYSALMAPLLQPDAIKCSVSVNGVTDPIAQMGRYRNGNREIVSYWEQYIGSLFSDESQHVAITPLERLAEYRKPVLLMHGDEDTRVEFSQYEAFVNRVNRNDDWLTPIVMRGEDHFLFTQSAREQVLEASLAFLAEHHPAD